MKKGTTAVLSTFIGAATGAASAFTQMNKKVKELKNVNYKNDQILKLYNQWLNLRQEGKSLAEYFKDNEYHKIAVYGMHYLGESLCNELENTGIEIKYGIDKNADNIVSDIDIYLPNEELRDMEKVDAVVVTAFFFYWEIEEQLSQYLDCPIISLEDIVYEL